MLIFPKTIAKTTLKISLDDYIENKSYISEKIKPDVTTIYDPYKIQIPSKKNISLAYIFKRGLVSFDYGVKNYGKTLFKETSNKTSNYLNNLNSKISAELRSVNTLRVGGEYIIGLFSIRAGVLNEKSFQKNITLNNVATSWGFGINFKRSAIDIAFIDNKNKNSYNLFPVILKDNYYVTNNKSQIINKPQKPITQKTINKDVDFKLSDENVMEFILAYDKHNNTYNSETISIKVVNLENLSFCSTLNSLSLLFLIIF